MAKMSWPRGYWIHAVALSLLGFVSLGFVGHRFAADHVRHYTGLDATTVNCVSCHYVGYGGTLGDRLERPRYRSPLELAVSPDGRWLVATASEGDSLLLVDLEARRLLSEIPVGSHPHGVVLSNDGLHAFVANESDDSVSVVDLKAGRVAATLPAGHAPAGLALAAGEGQLFVANWSGNDLTVVDLASGEETRRLSVGNHPCDLALTPDRKLLLVTNQLSYTTSRPNPPVSEVTLIDVEHQVVRDRRRLENAHLLESVAVAPQGDLALVTLVRPKNLLPAIQVVGGWMMTNGLGVIELATGRVWQVLLDEPSAFYADPCDVVFSPDGHLAFVSHSGVDVVSVVDVGQLRALLKETPPEDVTRLANHLGSSRRVVRARIRTGTNPKGLAVSPDGKWLYVAERLADTISAINVDRLELAWTIELTSTGRETVLRRGERLFNSATQTFQGQFSCRSCHPNNQVDGLQYDFEPDGLGRNIVDNRTMLDLRHTAPFKWNGKNTSMYMQCGMRFAKFLTRVEPFCPDDLNALVAFMRSLKSHANRRRLADGTLTPAQRRGKELFERTTMRDGTPIAPKKRCVTCHPPPLFTNRKKADVGSRSATDDARELDTPHLINIEQSAPYLHDGKAISLEEIWTRFNPDDTHGITVDLSKRDLNDLIEYLKAL